MSIPVWARYSLVAAVGVGLFLSKGAWLGAATGDYVLAQKPLYMGEQVPPLMMMVMSRDEQLFNKAYSDYSDLDGDGVLDTTYTDEFSYSGYFDSKLCYSYSSSRFKAAAVAGGVNGHSCPGNSHWSGNFLNWSTMSRLDIVRHVLYGGKRSTDEVTSTILERAHIPNDLHAWVKVYGKADIGSFTPYTSGTYSFCNSSHGANSAPQMRVASGNWSEWASTALNQCRTGYNSDTPGTAETRNVRVEVCDAGVDGSLREEFCRPYGTQATSSHKPTGLLQTYGESGRLRFGMVSGSYSAPRSGGVLRRNIGRIAGNGSAPGCVDGDEINLATGQFCNQGSGEEGIINTLERFKLTTWNGWTSDGKWTDCNDWGILNRQGQGRPRSLNNPGTGSDNCSAWGNPLAEMYAEALRYVTAEGATASFSAGSELAGLPTSVAWRDPYRSPDQGGNSYCASCSILVMSSGLPSFDSDEIPGVSALGATASAATDEVGTLQGITGGSYLAGRIGQTPLGDSLNTHEDVCKALDVTGLSDVRGVCPDIPSLEGSYLVSGLAYKAHTVDLRPGIQGKPAAHRNTVTTYGVALADNLPKFDIPVGGQTIQLAPLCQANATGGAAIADGGWRTCALGSVGIGPKTSTVSPNHTYGRELLYDGSRAVAGSFSLVWEDSLWGNDHDNDVVSMMTYCVGSACDLDAKPGYSGKDICWRSDSPVCAGSGRPVVQPDEVLVRIENLSAYAGNGMLTGFGVSGSNNDGVHRLARRPGGTDGSILTSTAEPNAGWDKPKVMKFTPGSNDTGVLENPLWYAAKFGGFNDLNGNGEPDPGEWDTREAGQPDNYFFARDPSKLKAELERIFESAAAGGGDTGGGGAGARINAGSFTLSTSFNVPAETTDWTGNLIARRVNPDGSEGAVLWNAASRIPAAPARDIFTTLAPTSHRADGRIDSVVSAVEFLYPNLGGTNAARNAALGVPGTTPAWYSGRNGNDLVAYLRGDAQYEGTNFRTRSWKLGDIINSDPEIVTGRDDFGYRMWEVSADAAWRTLGASYREYLEVKADNDPVVYVGANDGMLHAFDGSEAGGGDELFAFIPASSRAKLFGLANPDYEHRYYVDGAIRVSDVATSASGNWKSVLVGTTGAGGTTVFGLDVSDPDSFGAGDVLWEIDGSDEEDLGSVLGSPVIAAVNVGGAPRWVALFGNGVNSESGLPTLYAVDAWSGEIVAKLQPTASEYAMSNGLMNIAPVALGNGQGLVDTVYGGDLQGNVWRFDLASDDVSDWSVSFGGQPLFTANRDGMPQPITGGIEVSRGPGGGVSLFFGTGRYFVEGDNDNTEIQSLYSIWDNCQFATSCVSRIADGRNELVEQQITTGTSSSGQVTRDVTRNFVSYALKRGWYVDLVVDGTITGERMIGTPTLQSGRVFFTTYVPTARVCSAGGGVNWLYGLNMLTGGGAMSGVTLTPGADGEAACEGANCGGIALNNPNDSGDTAPPTRVTNVFIPPTGTCDPADPDCTIDKQLELSQCTFVLRATGSAPLFMPRPCGRQSWRQVR